MSSHEDRFRETQRCYRDTQENFERDLKRASSQDEVRRVIRNKDRAEVAYLRAGRAILERNGQDVEDAYLAAKRANDAVVQAREAAKSAAELVRTVSAAVGSVESLLRKAAL